MNNEELRKLFLDLADRKPNHLYVRVAFGKRLRVGDMGAGSQKPMVACVFAARYRLRQEEIQIAMLRCYGTLDQPETDVLLHSFGRTATLHPFICEMFEQLRMVAPGSALHDPDKAVQIVQVDGETCRYLGARFPAVPFVMRLFCSELAKHPLNPVQKTMLRHITAFNRGHDSQAFERPQEERLI